MLHQRIAKRYATALLQVGKRADKLDRFASELDGLGEIVERAAGLREFLANPTAPIDEKARTMEEILARGQFSPEVASFLKLLVDNQRAQLLPSIAACFRGLVDAERGVLRGSVVSAEELGSGERDRIRTALEKSTGQKVELTWQTDPEVLAGIRVQIADVVLDATVAGQLRSLAETLKD